MKREFPDQSYLDVEHSSYQGHDEYSDRKAIVLRNAEGYYVKCYVNKDMVKRVDVYKHSELYAENTADNFVVGILNP